MPRYYVNLYVEVEAKNEDAALMAADDLCTAITVGDNDWERLGIISLDYDNRGDGPIVTEADGDCDAVPMPGGGYTLNY